MARGAARSTASPRSPFARGRGANGNPTATQPPAPPAPTSEDHDPTSLPIFAGAWTSEDQLPGRTRSEFTPPPARRQPRRPAARDRRHRLRRHRRGGGRAGLGAHRTVPGRDLLPADRPAGQGRRPGHRRGPRADGPRRHRGVHQVRGRDPRLDRPSAVEPPGRRTPSRPRSRPRCSVSAGCSRWSSARTWRTSSSSPAARSAPCGWSSSTAPWSRPPRSPTPRTSCASSSPTSAPGRTGPSPRPARTWTCACPAAPGSRPAPG